MIDQILHFNLTEWVTTIGTVGVLLVIFCETGLFVGCFFPGDSLLFTAGMLATRGVFHLSLLIPLAIIAAILGYACGYWFGDKLGYWLVKRPDGFFFKKKYLQQAHDFYDKHGGMAMVLCRLIPIVRTFCPIVAGMGEMPFRRYTVYNIIGALIWVPALTFLGYFVGNLFPNARHFILPMVLVIIVISVLPGVIHFYKQRRTTS
jgi:membrane-associated protein